MRKLKVPILILDIDLSFKLLLTHDVVIGPAKDGGYYLLGLKQLRENIFKGMPWSTDQVLSKTLNALEGNDVFLLEEKNDIDIIEDLEDHPDLLIPAIINIFSCWYRLMLYLLHVLFFACCIFGI